MVDEIYDRTYQAGRAELHDGIDRAVTRLVTGVGTTFRTIQAINFAAPWTKAGRRVSKNIECA